MPPPQALLGWIRRHGFGGTAFQLARAIARRGIPGRWFMRAAAKATDAKIEEAAQTVKFWIGQDNDKAKALAFVKATSRLGPRSWAKVIRRVDCLIQVTA